MRVLLDTQCWLYWLLDPDRLNAEAYRLFEENRHPLYLSAASSWEIAIKSALGKLLLPHPAREYVPARLREHGVTPIPIEHSHALQAGALPDHHDDPFDRLLVAQAQVDAFKLLTTDPQMLRYDVEVVWASRDPRPRGKSRARPSR